MSDLISRAAALDALDVLCQEHRYRIPGKRETYSQYNEAWQDALDRAEGAIFNLPSVQPDLSSYSDKLWRSAYERGKAEAIVMCKDCKHHRHNYAGDSWCGHPKGLGGFELMPTDFCSAAERRTDEA